MRFEQMNLIRPILRAIREVGYTEPTPIQQKTVPPVLQGKDVLGCAQTGTGKTAAFALPMLQRIARAEDFDADATNRPIRALILTPTRELALQIHENFVQYGKYLPVRCAVIFGGVNQNPQVEQLRAGVDILVATPGRLNDLIGQGHISLNDIRIFVLDEADRMLDMGFIHDVRKIMAKLPAVRQTLLFSATMPPQVEEIAAQLLTDPVNIKISPVTSTVDSVAQSVYFLAKADKIKLLLHLLNGNGVSGALVFTRTKHGADQVARQLNKNNVKALAIHGDKSQNARQTALSRFKAGEIDVLVATDIAARGIDIVELPTVINYNVPEEPETYIHRIGRTGRAGQEGVAITFCCSDELESFRDIEKLIDRKVTELICEWSVADMLPTKPERKQPTPRSTRGENGTASGKRESSSQPQKTRGKKVSAQEQTKPDAPEQVIPNAEKRGQDQSSPQTAKSGKKSRRQERSNREGGKQEQAVAEQPGRESPKQASNQQKKSGQEVSMQSQAATEPPKQEASPQKKPKQKANRPENPHREKPAQETRRQDRLTAKQPSRQRAEERVKPQTQHAASGQNKSKRTEESRGDKRQSRAEESRTASSGQNDPRPPKREQNRPAAPGEDRRYTDSGEHDGATGQQIVTKFNRSVWLEFQEPPKRPKKLWQSPTAKAAEVKPTEKTPEVRAEAAPETPAAEPQKDKGFHWFRRKKRP